MSFFEHLARWHVALIHFPIGLLVTAALVEIYGSLRRFSTPTVTAVVMTLCGALGALVASILGWELAEHTTHPDAETVVELHRWGGVAATVLAAVAGALGGLALRGRIALRWPFRVALFITAIIIILTAHWGGELIYGEDYFSLTGSQQTEEL